jgi:hypothetical protein
MTGAVVAAIEEKLGSPHDNAEEGLELPLSEDSARADADVASDGYATETSQ